MVFFLIPVHNKQTACHFATTLYIRNINIFLKTLSNNYYYLGQLIPSH